MIADRVGTVTGKAPKAPERAQPVTRQHSKVVSTILRKEKKILILYCSWRYPKYLCTKLLVKIEITTYL